MKRGIISASVAIVAVAMGVCPQLASGHPAHAKPVNYPYVVGFERFHSSIDDDDYLAQGGMILINELNCVACHAPPLRLKGQFQGVEATNLAGVASRLSETELGIMIRNPRFVKKDTVMPSLFSGKDRDLEEVDALKHYLAKFKTEIPDYHRGEIDRGRSLYHRIGCAACHAPEVGYRPPGIPENAEIEMAGLPSVPMNLADLYDLNALTHFLLHPHEHRPSGRMPDFKLSENEAADLAAYLKAGPDLELPENVTEALSGPGAFQWDAELAKQGEALFSSKGCIACHAPPEGKRGVPNRTRSLPLAKLNVTEPVGCLSDRPVGGRVPFYGLDVVQKRAITAAIERLPQQKPLGVKGEIDWRMKSLNCYACHEREGVGGAETAREVYFGVKSDEAFQLGREAYLPPDLTGVGTRWDSARMKPLLLEGKNVSPTLPHAVTRMPVYSAERMRPLLKALEREGD